MKRFPLTAVLICSAFASSGCSSVMSHTGASQGYYPGTRASAEMIGDDKTSWAIKPLAIIDLPFSAVLDTILLPWDYFRSDNNSIHDRVLQSEKMAGTDASLATAASMPAQPH
ncbi:YceK/YidQ family lipoprotein [Pantoea sp.]|uniref:YceK/YidQ family lipoprotein n=1 Tax=Pantoea sp. TaxID=69393 RepID=UPI0031E1FCF8